MYGVSDNYDKNRFEIDFEKFSHFLYPLSLVRILPMDFFGGGTCPIYLNS